MKLETKDATPRPEPSAERPRPLVAVTSWEALEEGGGRRG